MLEASGTDFRIIFSAQGSMSVQAAVATGMGLTVIAEGMVPPELIRVPDAWNLPYLGKIDIRLFKNKIHQNFPPLLDGSGVPLLPIDTKFHAMPDFLQNIHVHESQKSHDRPSKPEEDAFFTIKRDLIYKMSHMGMLMYGPS